MGYIQAPIPENEKERLKALGSYRVLDTLPEQSFDDLTAIAAHICNTPISLVSLIDFDRQWFKSHHGLDATETPRAQAFCAHAILSPDEVFHIPDAFEDERFRENPLATGAPHVRFYAGTPLVSPEGAALGTLCVIDHEPRNLSPKQLETLKALGRQVVAQLELRKKLMEVEDSKSRLIETNKDLETFTHVLSHDLKTPLRSLVTMAEWLKADCWNQINEQGREYIQVIEDQSKKLIDLMASLKEFLSSSASDVVSAPIELEPFLQDVLNDVERKETLRLKVEGNLKNLAVNQAALRQVFWNLLSNACKYSDKEITEVTVSAEREGDLAVIKVTDNGPGIDPKYHTKIFEVFESLNTHDRFGTPTTGMGLAIVRRLLKKQAGEICVESSLGKGTTFVISLPRGES